MKSCLKMGGPSSKAKYSSSTDSERTIDVHIRNLREKLGAYAYLIRNIRGVGYQFLCEEENGRKEE